MIQEIRLNFSILKAERKAAGFCYISYLCYHKTKHSCSHKGLRICNSESCDRKIFKTEKEVKCMIRIKEKQRHIHSQACSVYAMLLNAVIESNIKIILSTVHNFFLNSHFLHHPN